MIKAGRAVSQVCHEGTLGEKTLVALQRSELVKQGNATRHRAQNKHKNLEIFREKNCKDVKVALKAVEIPVSSASSPCTLSKA